MSQERHLATAEPQLNKSMGMLMSFSNMEFLNKEKQEHGTAARLGRTECQQCGFCCLRRPCIPTPDELEVIAKYLGLSVRDTLKTKMVVDINEKNIYYPVWANESQQDMVGNLLPYNRTYDRGYCIFFDRTTHNCLIYEVRPEAARITQCWANNALKFDPEDY